MVGFIVLDIGIRVSTWSWHRAVSMPYFGWLTVVGDVVFDVGLRSDFKLGIALLLEWLSMPPFLRLPVGGCWLGCWTQE